MKNIITLLLSLFIVISVMAQDKKVSEIKTSELPKAVNTWVKDNLPGSSITRAGKIEEKGVVTYAAMIESKGRKHSYLFDKDGKFIGKGDNAASQPKQTPPVSTSGVKAAPAPAPAPKK